MMNILDFIQDVTKEANAFTNHPAKKLSLEDRLLYLHGLALVMNADDQISDSEKDYLTILIKSFDLDQSLLTDLVAFAQSPDKDTTLAFFRTFRRNPLAQLFLFDAYMIAMRDEELHEKEQAVIDKLADQLEVLKGTQQDIFDLFCHIKHKDWEESSLYFSSHLLNPEYFKHLLVYFDVDLEQLLKKVGTRCTNRLVTNLFGLEWITLEYDDQFNMPAEKQITANFVDFSLSYGEVVKILQAMQFRGLIKCVDNKVVEVRTRRGVAVEQTYFDLNHSPISFDRMKASYYVAADHEIEKLPVKGNESIMLQILRYVGISEKSIALGKKKIEVGRCFVSKE